MNDLTTIRGDSETYDVELVDDAGDPFDLTNCEMTFTVGDLVTKTIGAGIVVDPDGDPAPDPTTGRARITLDAGDTADSPDTHTTYRYDVQVTTDTGVVKTPIRGLFHIIPDVTTD